MMTTRKRKKTTTTTTTISPRRKRGNNIVKELVPKDSPWSQSDWWNEKSGTCRPIVQAIRHSLDGAVEVFVPQSIQKLPIQDYHYYSPKSVLQQQHKNNNNQQQQDHNQQQQQNQDQQHNPPNDNNNNKNSTNEKVIRFDRGFVKYLEEEEGHEKGVWGVFHPNWGMHLSSFAAYPWRVKPSEGKTSSVVNPK